MQAQTKNKISAQGPTEGRSQGTAQSAHQKPGTMKEGPRHDGRKSSKARRTPDKQSKERDPPVLTPSEHSEFCYTPTVVKPEVAERCKFDAELATKLAEATKQIKDPARRRSPVLLTASDSPVSLTSSSSVKEQNKELARNQASAQPRSGAGPANMRKVGGTGKARDSRLVDRHKDMGRGNIQI